MVLLIVCRLCGLGFVGISIRLVSFIMLWMVVVIVGGVLMMVSLNFVVVRFFSFVVSLVRLVDVSVGVLVLCEFY